MFPLDSFQTKKCPSQFVVDSVKLDEQVTLCLTMTDPNGCALDVSHADVIKPCYVRPPPVPSSSSSVSASSRSSANPSSSSSPSQSQSSQSSSSVAPEGAPLPPGWHAYYLVKEIFWSNYLIKKRMRVEDASQGLFSVTFSSTDFLDKFKKRPGMYLAEIVIYDDKNVRRVSEFRYLQVAPTLEWANPGTITIAEIRMALLDYGCENTLLDDVEFSDTEIAFSIRRPVDRWNESTPNLVLYSPASFPWRENWMICTIGYLLRMAAHHYRRNHLTYQASGLNVADKDKFNQYEEVAKLRIAEFDQWMMNKKLEINIEQGYGTLASAYSRYWYWGDSPRY